MIDRQQFLSVYSSFQRVYTSITMIFLAILAILTVCLFLGACSVLDVNNKYYLEDQKSYWIEYKTDGVELLTGFNPDQQFYLIGPIGVPIIPTYIKPSDYNELNLAITLTLNRDYDFSFLPQPCLAVENSKLLCPDHLSISAVALYQNDGSKYSDHKKRWEKIPNFFNTNKLIFDFHATTESKRITREHIYQHYHYTKEQKWDYLRIDITYNYKCEADCPESLGLNTKYLYVIENLSIPAGNYKFIKTREHDYNFIAPLQ